MKKTRTLKDGQTITVRRNDGLRKHCTCQRRAWATCSHPWHFSFKWRDVHHRFLVTKYATGPIATRDDAKQEANRLRVEIQAGRLPSSTTAPPATVADLTFDQFIALWRERARADLDEEAKANEQGIARKLGALELSPGERLGARAIARITEDDIEVCFGKLTVKGSTWNKYRRLILKSQRWGVKKGYLTRPWLAEDSEQITHRKPGQRERRLVPDVMDDKGHLKTPGEERRLLAKASPWLQRLIIAALETCCRRGELLSLQWRDVTLTRNELTVRAENAKDDETRVLPISPRLLAVLKMIEHDPAGNPHSPAAYTFGDRIGREVKDPKKSWIKCRRDAGIADLHFHDLRHEAASRLVEQGWPLHHVQHMLGHSDLKTTSRYVNVTLPGLHESMKRFGTGQPLHPVAHETSMEPQLSCNDQSSESSKPLVN